MWLASARACKWKNCAPNLIKARKAVGPGSVTSILLKVCKNDSMKKLAEVADELLQGKKMPES